MKSMKLFAVVAALMAWGVGSAGAGEQLVLEEVIVRAKLPAEPAIEHVIVVSELPGSFETDRALDDEAAEHLLMLERPHVDTSAFATVELTPPTLRL